MDDTFVYFLNRFIFLSTWQLSLMALTHNHLNDVVPFVLDCVLYTGTICKYRSRWYTCTLHLYFFFLLNKPWLSSKQSAKEFLLPERVLRSGHGCDQGVVASVGVAVRHQVSGRLGYLQRVRVVLMGPLFDDTCYKFIPRGCLCTFNAKMEIKFYTACTRLLISMSWCCVDLSLGWHQSINK